MDFALHTWRTALYLLGWAINLLTLAIVVRAVLSWFPVRPRSTPVVVLDRITQPVVAPIRRALPRTGPLDLSPLIAIIILQLLARLVRYLEVR